MGLAVADRHAARCLLCSADRCCNGGLGDAGVQFLSVAYWYLLRKPAGVDLAAVTPLGWLAGLALVGFGQVSRLLLWGL